jgi:hypothetical protein
MSSNRSADDAVADLRPVLPATLTEVKSSAVIGITPPPVG